MISKQLFLSVLSLLFVSSSLVSDEEIQPAQPETIKPEPTKKFTGTLLKDRVRMRLQSKGLILPLKEQ